VQGSLKVRGWGHDMKPVKRRKELRSGILIEIKPQ